MHPEQVNWSSGEVVFWDLGFLDPLKPLVDQVDNLKEDLAQVRYPGHLVLDVGWYPEFSVDGEFVIRVIQNTDWDTPLFMAAHNTVQGLLKGLEGAIAAATSTPSGDGA